MRLQKLFAITTALALILLAGPQPPSALDYSCGGGANAGGCFVGDVTITGTGYPHNINVEVVKNGVSQGVDAYTAPRGNVNIVLDSSATVDAGSYVVRVLAPHGKNAGSELGAASFDIVSP